MSTDSMPSSSASSDISVPEYSRIGDSNCFEQSHDLSSPVASSIPASASQNDDCEFNSTPHHESTMRLLHDCIAEPSSLQEQLESQLQHTIASATLPTFKIVGDNIDKTVKPRFMRSDCQSKDLHFFHHFAVQDRVDMSTLSDKPPSPPSSLDSLPESLLPSKEDNKILAENFAIHISRILATHLEFFKDSRGTITRHIQHDYSKKMAQKINSGKHRNS